MPAARDVLSAWASTCGGCGWLWVTQGSGGCFGLRVCLLCAACSVACLLRELARSQVPAAGAATCWQHDMSPLVHHLACSCELPA